MRQSTRLVGVSIILLALLLNGIAAPGFSLSAFLDWPSLVWVLGFVAGGLLMAFSPQTIWGATLSSLTGRQPVEEAELRQYLAVFGRAYQSAWGAGIAGTLWGMMIMLGNLDDPDAIGPGMAVALMALFYGAMLAELILSPLQQSLLSYQNISAAEAACTLESGVSHKARLQPIMTIGLAMTFAIVGIFFIMLVSFIP